MLLGIYDRFFTHLSLFFADKSEFDGMVADGRFFRILALDHHGGRDDLFPRKLPQLLCSGRVLKCVENAGRDDPSRRRLRSLK